MNVEILKQFTEIGAKPEEAIYRFLGKEEIYKTFLKKYLADNSIDVLKQAIQDKNAYEIFKACHTLKGVAANLGLDCVQSKASEMTEYTREKSFAELEVSVLLKMLKDLEDCNQKVCKVIEIYCQ